MPVVSVSDSVYYKTILLFSFSENQVVFSNNVDPVEMTDFAEFHLLFTVYKSTR